MRQFDFSRRITLVAISLAVLSTQAAAQDSGRPVTDKDLFTPQQKPLNAIIPAPANHDIVVRFGDYARVHFRRPVKSLRMEDELTVKAVPESDHVIRFIAQSPGATSFTLEQDNGVEEKWGVVSVISQPHEVKIYTPSAGKDQGKGGNSLITVVNQNSGDVNASKAGEASDYHSVLCDEVSCKPLPEPEKK